MKIYGGRMVLLRAFVNNNFGDDLFISIICKRYPNTKFVMFGLKKYRDSFTGIQNLKYIVLDSIPMKMIHKIFSLIKRDYDLVAREIPFINFCSGLFEQSVFITGSYFAEASDWTKIMDYKWYKKHPHIIGCNFGPWKSERYLEEYRRCFALAAEVSFRDQFSFNLFKEMPNVRYAPDIIFGIEKGQITDNGYYIISVVNPLKDDYLNRDNSIVEKYIQKMASICNYLSTLGKKVYIVSFCEEQGDNMIASRIMENCDNIDLVKNITYGNNYNIDYMIKLFRECHMVIASRFHAMIMAIRFQKYVIPIIYNNKMTTVLNDINFAGDFFAIENIEELCLENVMKEEYICPMEMIDQIAEKSLNHFCELDKILN
ncbi:polysaccharide pyruvyl transferase family protein (plasmid) [Butyrivibrio fibrisolvens]